jgi:hypothetical protein
MDLLKSKRNLFSKWLLFYTWLNFEEFIVETGQLRTIILALKG